MLKRISSEGPAKPPILQLCAAIERDSHLGSTRMCKRTSVKYWSGPQLPHFGLSLTCPGCSLVGRFAASGHRLPCSRTASPPKLFSYPTLACPATVPSHKDTLFWAKTLAKHQTHENYRLGIVGKLNLFRYINLAVSYQCHQNPSHVVFHLTLKWLIYLWLFISIITTGTTGEMNIYWTAT